MTIKLFKVIILLSMRLITKSLTLSQISHVQTSVHMTIVHLSILNFLLKKILG
jgi:hypothetical protein